MATSVDSFNDLKELGIDCDDNSLTEKFNKAADHLQNLLPSVDDQVLLSLYGYFKQGSQGPCNTAKPGWFDMKAKAKWEAWKKLGDMSPNKAKALYIETIKSLDPGFNPSAKDCWVSVSTPNDGGCCHDCGRNFIIDYVRDNDCTAVTELLESPSGKDQVDKIYENGLGALHWAADRGFYDMLKLLISSGADVNLQDADGQTALHYASSCGHVDCVKLLLEHGARRDILDVDGSSPVAVAADEAVKELLEKFV